jgi:hypothetical protein
MIFWGVLTIIQNWIAQGWPDPKSLPPFGSFEEYRRVIGGILQAAGINGFLGNLQGFYQSSDQETQTLDYFIQCWWDSFRDKGVGVNELYPMVKDKPVPLDLGRKQSEHSEQTVLGKILSGLRDRRFGRYGVMRAGKRQGAQQYRLIRIENEEQKEAH